MRVHHIGYAVRSIEKAMEGFRALGYVEEGKPVFDKGRNVSILFMTNGGCRIELVEAGNPAVSSPVDSWLKNQKGGSQPYHLCYGVPDIGLGIERLKREKFILTEQPKPAPAISNHKVAFLYKRAVGLIELVEMQDGFDEDSGAVECEPVQVNQQDEKMGRDL